jgi:hypothetical protein
MGVEISNLGNFYYPKNKNEDKRQVNSLSEGKYIIFINDFELPTKNQFQIMENLILSRPNDNIIIYLFSNEKYTLNTFIFNLWREFLRKLNRPGKVMINSNIKSIKTEILSLLSTFNLNKLDFYFVITNSHPNNPNYDIFDVYNIIYQEGRLYPDMKLNWEEIKDYEINQMKGCINQEDITRCQAYLPIENLSQLKLLSDEKYAYLFYSCPTKNELNNLSKLKYDIIYLPNNCKNILYNIDPIIIKRLIFIDTNENKDEKIINRLLNDKDKLYSILIKFNQDDDFENLFNNLSNKLNKTGKKVKILYTIDK